MSTATSAADWADLQTKTSENHPCNIYFAIFFLTITFNMQHPPEIIFVYYTHKPSFCQARNFFLFPFAYT
jgi:hypothetical protein